MLEIKNVSKFFPGVKALDNVSVKFHPGEIHALLGENGAGKSTLIKIISGLYQADEGSIHLDNKKLELRNYKDSVANGIAIVNQEIQVIPEFDVAENVILDKMDQFSKRGVVNWKKIYASIRPYLDEVGLGAIDANTRIALLSTAQKQMVQIAKALTVNANVILFDEPTSSLSQHEADLLYKLIRKLKAKGLIIIFVSHKLEEVMELCDVATVLRDGQVVGTRKIKEVGNVLTKEDIVQMMINRKMYGLDLGKLEVNYNKKVLEVKNIHQKKTFTGVSFELYQGEILGFYGLVGAGRTELAKIIIGEDLFDEGEILVNGQTASINSVSDAVNKYGLGYSSENRKDEGLIQDATVKTNICITMWRQLAKNVLRKIDVKQETKRAKEMCDIFDTKITGLNQRVVNLSGGNQQKIVMSKWLGSGCDILIIDEPTIGVDVGAKEAIHKLIWKLAREENKSILLISSDMKEICTLARRILVFRDYKIAGEVNEIADGDKSPEEISEMIGKYLA